MMKGGIKKKEVAAFIYGMRISNIEKHYPQYLSIVSRFRISNPGSQHTSSFHPLQFHSLKEQEEFKKNFLGIPTSVPDRYSIFVLGQNPSKKKPNSREKNMVGFSDFFCTGLARNLGPLLCKVLS